MTWWTATSVAINNGQSIVNVTTGDDIQIAQEAGGLIIGNNPPVEIKRTFLDGTGAKKIELRLPWPYSNVTTQSAVAFPTDADLAEATRVLRAVGSDAVTFAEALAQVIGSTANTITVSTETSGDLSVVPYGKLTQQVQDLLSVIGDFGTPLLSSTNLNDARNKLGLAPRIAAQPTLDLDFTKGDFKVYEQYGLTKKTIAEAITTTRGSVATYNSPFGIATAATNEPRIEYDPTTGENLGLLAEEQRTNLLLWSEQFDNSWWDKIGSTVEANAELSPNLTNTVDKFVESSTNSVHRVQKNISGISGVEFSSSIFVKGDGSRKIGLTFGSNDLSSFGSAIVDLSNGQLTVTGGGSAVRVATVQKFSNGYFRVTLTVSNIAATAHRFIVSILPASATTIFDNYQGDGASGIYIWGAQLETGSFPTSYIKTEGSQVTRLSDRYSRTSRFFNNDAGAFAIKINSSLYNGNNNAVIFEIADPSRTERIEIRRVSSTRVNVVITSASGTQSSTSVILDKDSVIALSFNTNSVKFAVTGSQIITVPLTLRMGGEQTLSIGANTVDASFSRTTCVIKRLKPYAKALSNQELIDLTRL